jgi:hypothetical protein
MLAATVPALRAREWTVLNWPVAYGTFALLWVFVLRFTNVSQGLVGYWDAYTSAGPGDGIADIARVLSAFFPPQGIEASGWVLVPVLMLVWVGLKKQPLEFSVLLWGPLVTATVASFAGVPLGTGRTDLYLYAPLAIGVASGVQWASASAPTSLRLLLVGTAVLLAVWLTQPPRYPVHDVRPLIEEAVVVCWTLATPSSSIPASR